MFLHYRTLCIALKKEDRGEADQIFTIFTKDLGKLEILGKAIRKVTSKLRSGINLFSISEIEFIQSKTYKILTDTLLIKQFKNIKKDLLRLKIAFQISKVADELIEGQEKDEKIWKLLTQTFDGLNNFSGKKINFKLIYYYFLWNLVNFLGYKPELYFCVLCQNKLKPEKLYFSREGGTICNQCSKKEKFAILITPEAIKILRKILEKNWKVLKKLKIEKKHLEDLEKISRFYIKTIKNEENKENI